MTELVAVIQLPQEQGQEQNHQLAVAAQLRTAEWQTGTVTSSAPTPHFMLERERQDQAVVTSEKVKITGLQT